MLKIILDISGGARIPGKMFSLLNILIMEIILKADDL